MTCVPPSGVQFEIVHGEQRATIVEVGGGIRAFAVGGRDVLDAYPLDALADGAHGAPLIPWPNRLADGRYSFDGVPHQLPLSEPERGNAIHGLLRWRAWRASEREPGRVVMGIRLHPMPGYPFALDVRVAYELSDEGLAVTTTATNVGDRACPYGAGQHPYLSAGGGLIDDCSLELRAATRIVVDEARMLPTGREAVAGTPFDFNTARTIGAQQLDLPYTDLARDAHGIATARLAGPDGRVAELWVDERHPLLEVYSGDQLDPSRRRRGLGMEPMTCPPNSFRSGELLVRLEPGASHSARWGARLA